MLTRYNQGWECETMIQSNFDGLRRAKSFRERRNLPLRIIAQESGLSLTTVQRFSTGAIDRFDRTTLERLCRYFGVKSISELIEYTPEAP